MASDKFKETLLPYRGKSDFVLIQKSYDEFENIHILKAILTNK